MNFRNSSREHKGFLLGYFFWMFVSLIIVGASFGIGVYTARPVEQKIASSILSVVHDAPPVVAKTVDELLLENFGKTANLTPAQWKSIRSQLDALTNLQEQHDLICKACQDRCRDVSHYSEFVVSNFESFSQQTKESWRTFSTAQMPDYYPSENWARVDFIRDKFVLYTLNVQDVVALLKWSDNFQGQNDYINQQSARIDQMMAEFLAKGLKLEPSRKDYVNGNYVIIDNFDPKNDFKTFIEIYGYGQKHFPNPISPKLPPQDLPPCPVTRELLVQQLFQPELSAGTASSDRAAK